MAPDRVGIVVNGVSGRMGRMLVQVIAESERAELAGALERRGHEWVGRDLGEAMGGAASGITVSDDPARALAGARAVVDFTTPAASLALARVAADQGVAHVIGTTGFSTDDLTTLAELAHGTVIVRAGNMSLGVNLLVELTRQVAAALDPDWDIEIVEAHHRHKVDAPSGTALMLGDAAAAGRGVDLAQVSARGRDGMTGARNRGDIGFAALRGGDIVGEHEVVFAGNGERLTLGHVATDRAIYARGALKAALWAQGKSPGEYGMRDVLGLGKILPG
ncbi:4-hydroxy-tetrahydrodipicolinate reductase [Pararhodobacter sp. SW119]|uniref:4-hydroxy-tetrahydrodipicolinate reductase n=1 Tax=Pararhodobacter sp. SW119 TaxID=2780075 RepID=UPI001ADEC932|nr:4-hydroxy-tetrahydrodipicolinate reductase [Pararhodobacter sp. SW119]